MPMARRKDGTTRPSRSEKRKKAEDLQALGERLMELTEEKIKSLELPEDLEEAIIFAKSIDSRGALRRQKQFIGKLMRKIDPKPIETVMRILDSAKDAEKRSFHRLEKWRDRLVNGDKKVLGEIMEKYPDCEEEKIADLTRQAQKEAEAEKPPRAARKLFKYLRQLMETVGGTLPQ